MSKKGPVGPTFIIGLKFDVLDFSTEAIKYVMHFVLFVEYIKMKNVKTAHVSLNLLKLSRLGYFQHGCGITCEA